MHIGSESQMWCIDLKSAIDKWLVDGHSGICFWWKVEKVAKNAHVIYVSTQGTGKGQEPLLQYEYKCFHILLILN